MKKSILVVLGSALALVAAEMPAAAQDKLDVGVGYQFQRGEDTNFPIGFNFDVAGKIRPNLSWVGQVDWSRHTESTSESDFGLTINTDATANITSFGAGVRWTPPTNMSVSPYVQALVGAARSSFSASVTVDPEEFADFFGDLEQSGSSTDAVFQVGAGVAFPLSDKIAGVGQVDFRRILSDDAGNVIRFVIGIRWMNK